MPYQVVSTLPSATSRCLTGNCDDNSLLHSTRVDNYTTEHQICITTVPFDVRCESVTLLHVVSTYIRNYMIQLPKCATIFH